MCEEFDPKTAIGLVAATKLVRGRKGKAVAVETLRRWSNPRKGCRPQGPDGPALILRTVKLNGECLTTAAWVEEFEAERARLGARPGGVRVRPGGPMVPGHAEAERRLRDKGRRRNQSSSSGDSPSLGSSSSK